MPIEIKVPEIGESITEVEIGGWLKRVGEPVTKDEMVVTLESDKATMELAAPESGTLTEIVKQKGETAKVGEVIARIQAGVNVKATPAKEETKAASEKPARTMPADPTEAASKRVMPAAQVALEQHGLRAEAVQGTGPGGRVLKEDVLRHVETGTADPSTPALKETPPSPAPAASPPTASPVSDREEEVVPMSRLRRTVAERLVEAQHTAALLTTFNEIDMSAVLALRKEFAESFQKRYEARLGFMSFFIKASIDALRQFPALNARVQGPNIIYHNFYDIGVAVGSGKGLVVPVLRNAERKSFAEIEIAIADFGRRAKDNKLKLEELQGGTFTISNGGVYGSLLSTPIINPPQSGILGLHAIQDRPVAREGNVVIRPMMYTALTYDHRLVDGREAVSFLKRIKDVLENPARMLMEI
jgi:2-oxoglutarate dehydrogenase E2 component (dihydrolipoamide succinyltransferase)